MARLVGVDLPREKRVEIALTYIFGIGLTRAHATLAATGISARHAIAAATKATSVPPTGFRPRLAGISVPRDCCDG